MLWQRLLRGQGGRCNYKADVTKVARGGRRMVTGGRGEKKKGRLFNFSLRSVSGHGRPQIIEEGGNADYRDRGSWWKPGWPKCWKRFARMLLAGCAGTDGNTGEAPGRFWLGFCWASLTRAPPHLVFRSDHATATAPAAWGLGNKRRGKSQNI